MKSKKVVKKRVVKSVKHKSVKRAAKKSTTKKKFKKVMAEFSAGELHSGSKKGPIVTNPKQAIAISFSESRKASKKK
jgi:hypothetical protein